MLFFFVLLFLFANRGATIEYILCVGYRRWKLCKSMINRVAKTKVSGIMYLLYISMHNSQAL